MRVVRVEALQGPEAAKLTDSPKPEPRAGEALVRVHAAGINYADIMQTRGLYVGGPKPPYVAGIEAAGEVVSVGQGVTLPVGARVMGFGAGAFAEYVSWPATNLLPIPASWSFDQAAAFPIQWLTAHGCLRVCGRLQAGESVLVHAAAGGVGTAAVHLAKHYGARVFATASSAAKLEIARQHGADELIDYTKQDFVAEVKRLTDGRGVDLILQMVGGQTFDKNFEAVVPFGRIVVFGSASAQEANVTNTSLIFRPVEVIGYHLAKMATYRPDLLQRDLAELLPLIEQGVAVPEQPSAYPLERCAEALEALATRRTTGKLVLTP
jgi:NADPH2:quinone reductase